MPVAQDFRSFGACPCGASKFEVRGKVLTRFVCHCTICQGLYKAPFADVATQWSGAVEVTTPDSVSYRRYRPPPAVSRGTCDACGAPVVGRMLLAPFMRVALVPTRNLASLDGLPAPGSHIFYHRRVSDAADDVPRFSGYWRSLMAVTTRIVAGMMRRGA